MKSHGGKRKGAGKPAQYDKPMRAVEVTLDEETIEFYKSVGNGNLSKGIREHWRGLTKRAPGRGKLRKGLKVFNKFMVLRSRPCG